MPKADDKLKPGGVFLDRACDLKDWADAAHPRYPALAGVRIDVKRRFAEATDGRAMIRVPLPESPEGFPVSQPRSSLTNGVVVDAVKIGDVFAKDVPKKSYRPELLLVKVSSGDNGHVVLSSTDGAATKDVSLGVLEGCYPDTNEVWPPPGDPVCSFSIGADFLAKLARYAKAHADGWVEVALHGHERSLQLSFSITLKDGRVVSGVSTTARKDA